MKSILTEITQPKLSFTTRCALYCRGLVNEMQKYKSKLATQFRQAFPGREQLLRLTLNEAEAIAFETEYPHLVFPTLALEKLQGAMAWTRHQQEIVSTPTLTGNF
jgi:hypothetical protein